MEQPDAYTEFVTRVLLLFTIFFGFEMTFVVFKPSNIRKIDWNYLCFLAVCVTTLDMVIQRKLEIDSLFSMPMSVLLCSILYRQLFPKPKPKKQQQNESV